MKTNDNNVDVLYIEDNEDFISFVGMALKKIDKDINYAYVTDGLEAQEIIENNDEHNPYQKAKVILLDYHLPGVDGIKLLDKIRSKKTLMHTPVVMFSSSEDPTEIENAYNHGANAYLIKPIGMTNLTNTIKTVCEFWLHKNRAV